MHIAGKVMNLVGTFRVLRAPFETIAQKRRTLGDHNLFFLTKELVNTFLRGCSTRLLKTDQFLIFTVISKKCALLIIRKSSSDKKSIVR